MQIAEGGFYRTRNGCKVGPMQIDFSEPFPAIWSGYCWSMSGRASQRTTTPSDIVAPWTDGQPAPEAVKCGEARCIDEDRRCAVCDRNEWVRPPAPEKQTRAGDVATLLRKVRPFVAHHDQNAIVGNVKPLLKEIDDMLAAVEPRREPLKVGDRVWWSLREGLVHRIVHIENDAAWVRPVVNVACDDVAMLSDLEPAHE